jgi:hypothetical protein
MPYDKKELENSIRKTCAKHAKMRSFVQNMPIIDVCEKAEALIRQKGKPAFPCNVSINEVAAHYTSACRLRIPRRLHEQIWATAVTLPHSVHGGTSAEAWQNRGLPSKPL